MTSSVFDFYARALRRCRLDGPQGTLDRAASLDGESLLRNLVSEPTATVAGLSVDDAWPSTEARIVAELAAAPDKATRDAVKLQIPALVPARFKANARSKAECLGRQLIGHDFDHVIAETFEAACESIRASLPDRSWRSTRPRPSATPTGLGVFRVYEVLDREATPTDWESRVKPHMRSLGEHDEGALDVSRLLYMPFVPGATASPCTRALGRNSTRCEWSPVSPRQQRPRPSARQSPHLPTPSAGRRPC